MHKRIKSFFAQFKKNSTFNKIRSELQREKSEGELDLHAVDMRMSTSNTGFTDYSSNQKVLPIMASHASPRSSKPIAMAS